MCPEGTGRTFDSPDLQLDQLLKDIAAGDIQLPDFQRDWVWDDDHIRDLLASVSMSFPIGALMLLETGGDGVHFKPRPLEGVQLNGERSPSRLVLDGQQRLTALYLALRSGRAVVAPTKRRKKVGRWYYLDIRKALGSSVVDHEDAIVSVPEDRKIRNFRGEVVADYEGVERECEAELLPLPLVFDVAAPFEWQAVYVGNQSSMQERFARWKLLFENVIQRFQQYQIPTIVLHKNTPKAAVCKVFEKVNTGGVTLTVFELLTAIFAAEGYQLRQEWIDRHHRFRTDTNLGRLLERIENTDFLQAVTLLATRDRQLRKEAGQNDAGAAFTSCKRHEILELKLDEYQRWAPSAEEGFFRAAKLLHRHKIFSARDVPYRTQMTPLAAVLALIGERVENPAVRQQLMQWYWCGVFGELYGGAIESRFARDLPEVLAWVAGSDSAPSTVTDANFSPARLRTMRTRLSAAYKGVHALLLGDGAQDFRTTDELTMASYFDDAIDVHHVFPQRWCAEHGIDRMLTNSIINKTPLAAKTNRIISGRAPSEYVVALQRYGGADISDAQVDAILEKHGIDPTLLRADDFAGFFAAREAALLRRIGDAMGKEVATETGRASDDDLFDEDEEAEEVA